MTLSERAIARAQHQSANGPRYGVGQCMMRTRRLFDAPAVGDYDRDGAADAEDGWKAAKRKHPTSDPKAIPAGVPVWWSGGSHDHGHVAISTGDGWCWSTDIKRNGYYDHVPIDLIRQRWGLTLLGWSEDIGGVDVYEPHVSPQREPATEEDDDMPTAKEFWHERIGEEKLPESDGVYAEVALTQVYMDTRALRAEVAALRKDVQALISKEK